MKLIGIVGGIGPESTIDYYRLFISIYRERRPDGGYPAVVINSIDLSRVLNLIASNDLAGLAAYVLEEIHRLARAGATHGLPGSDRSKAQAAGAVRNALHHARRLLPEGFCARGDGDRGPRAGRRGIH